MSGYQTPQEAFWAGAFGSDYTQRNQGERLVASNASLFQRLLAKASPPASILELGANIGLNLVALRQLLPEAHLAAVEINPEAVSHLRRLPEVEVFHESLLEFQPPRAYDLVFTKGVLIHIAPEQLPKVYDLMYRASRRYVALAEYYNPTPVSVPYRGHLDRLFKRDFAGELLDRFPDLRLVDYGFVYRRDPAHPQDDLTWFLLEKTAGNTAI
ncbi:methyltransferase domain-containing protein [Fontisphaera persica]|uniref:pseudaminic acid biosynthesis-associated methylase n=1 Tax=Fontisphaera persica TaxID=2974023 RepID=UPI0024BFAA53|nr:pseudaminic acid biosynthesis-associated methylase [Fontisphaera persica]WCJ60815.1 methyltransferase domain-containing protein [Fontisphaera persica]